MDNKIIFNRKNIKPFRAYLRSKTTSAEGTLWKELRSRNLEGRKFRRQHSIGKYIVDFYCPSEKLVIELDGDPHGDPARIDRDIERDNFLKELGLTVLRFENRFVFQDPDFVLGEIKKSFKNSIKDHT